jgi:RNA binding exosome subunit
MNEKLEISIDIIAHATEDVQKIINCFEIFEITQENFSINETSGHFENPIFLINAELEKKSSQRFMKKFLENISKDLKSKIIEEIEERTQDSRLHIRLSKQDLINGKISLQEQDTVKIKIHTPIYNKNNTVKIFSEILSSY